MRPLFCTTNRYLTAWLLAHGLRLVRHTIERGYVSFEVELPVDPTRMKGLVDSFWANGVVGVKDFIAAYKSVQQIVAAERDRGGKR